MVHYIENSELKVGINHTGAELCSIVSKKTRREYMWEGNEEIWGSTAPVLFPIIGSLKDNKYLYSGMEYYLPKHGFIRHNNQLKADVSQRNTLEFTYKFNDETLKMYPFKFEFSVLYKLEENRIRVIHNVRNTGNEHMLFSLGGHPAFKCPFLDGERLTDYYIEFEEKENAPTWVLNAQGLLTNKTKKVLDNARKLPLTNNIFDEDALIFKNLKSRKVRLKSMLNAAEVVVRFHDFEYLGLWSKPGAPFVCIEPWLGVTDNELTEHNFEQKEGVVSLAGNTDFCAEFSIEIHD